MSKFNINNNTSLYNDPCAVDTLDKDNEILSKHAFPSYLSDIDPSRNKYFDSFDQPGVFQTGNFAGFPSHVNDASSIRQGKYGNIITHDRTKRQNPYSKRFNPPFKGPQTMALQPDVMSKLYSGQMTKDKASTRGRANGKHVDPFTPLIPEIESQIQNPKHLVPEYWVHGGMDTRTVIRNVDYLKSCGLKR